MSHSARRTVIASVLLCLLLIVFTIRGIWNDLSHWEVAYHGCPDGSECQRLAKLFSNDYNESKDLAKSFLTLLVAVFVASVTFSEKIVDVRASGRWPKRAMISCWLFLLLAIVTSGIGIGYMAYAYGMATYNPELDYRFFETRAVLLFFGSGVLFGVGLCAMFLAGLSTLHESVKAAESKESDSEPDIGDGLSV